MKRKHLIVACIGFAASLLGATAYAGYKQSYTVSVNTTSRYAYGNAGAARSSPDVNQFIGCTLSYSANGGGYSGYCEAETSTPTLVYCMIPSTAVDGFAKVLATVASNPYYYFAWDANGNCTSISVDNFSFEQPIVY